VARRVRDAERRLELLERRQVPKPPPVLSFTGVLAPGGAARLEVHDLVVPGRLELPRLVVAAGERLLVTGANGSGKSTLLKVLAGRVRPTAGRVHVDARRIGFLPQEVRFPQPGRSAAAVWSAAIGEQEPGVRLGELGLVHPRELHRPVGELSTGQQRRLALAVVVARRPDLVLLDEPTNHLSLALATELEEALVRSPGTVVVATHDRWLRRRWDGTVMALH
jgi:macrolide transport system ATP-binding/permease protein